MKLYFSGIKDAESIEILKKAEVKLCLFNWNDYDAIKHQVLSDFNLIVDCNAYKLWGGEINVETYLDFVINFPLEVDFFVAPDVIGDAEATLTNWQKVQQIAPDKPWLPVWHWGENIDGLKYYLDQAEIVGVGGLVPLMREGQWDKTDQAEQMLDELVTICHQYKRRLHIFGLCWLKAIESVNNLAYSADTSKYIDGARYCHIIFRNTRTFRLQQCPHKSIPQYAHLDRIGRCIESAKTLNKYCNIRFPLNVDARYYPGTLIEVMISDYDRTDRQQAKLKLILEANKFIFNPQDKVWRRREFSSRKNYQFWENEVHRLLVTLNVIKVNCRNCGISWMPSRWWNAGLDCPNCGSTDVEIIKHKD